MALFKPWTWFGRLEQKLLGSGGIDGTIRSFLNQYTRNDLTGAEQQQNAFNAEQAQNQMNFQREMSNTAYQRETADMRAAGVNPALVYASGSSGASTPSGAAASGSAFPGLGMSDLMNLLKTRAEIQLMKAQEKRTLSDIDLNRVNTEYRQQELSVFRPLTELQMKNLEADLRNKDVRARLDESGIKVNEAESALRIQQKILLSIDEKSRAELNRLEVRQRIASISYSYAQTSKAKKELSKIDAEINELYQRAIQESCSAGLMDQQTRNLLVEHGILVSESEGKAYQVKNKRLTYILDCVGKTLGSVASAAGTFGALGVGARAFGMLQAPMVSAAPNLGALMNYGYNYNATGTLPGVTWY